MRSPTTRTRHERITRAIAAQNPFQHPPLKWWHVLLAVLSVALGYLAIRAPGLLADVASHPVADWRVFVLTRGTIIILSVYVLLFVRSYHPVAGFGLVATITGLSLRIGYNQVTEAPLDVGFLILLLALAVLPVRIIIRPNAEDVARNSLAEIKRLTAENERLKATDERAAA